MQRVAVAGGVLVAAVGAGMLVAAALSGAGGRTAARAPQRPVVTAGARADSAAVLRIARDRSRQCIPVRPEVMAQCDPARQAEWDNEGSALAASLPGPSLPAHTLEEVLAAYLRLHAEAGDIDVLAQLAQRLGVPDVRLVAVGLAPDDPTQEYVELQNVGGEALQLARLALPTPGGENRYEFGAARPTTIAPGQSCRVYTRSAGQLDACAGQWAQPNRTGIWPAEGAWVTLLAVMPEPSRAREIDRWYYRP